VESHPHPPANAIIPLFISQCFTNLMLFAPLCSGALNSVSGRSHRPIHDNSTSPHPKKIEKERRDGIEELFNTQAMIWIPFKAEKVPYLSAGIIDHRQQSLYLDSERK
jgi:hypothetical protein